MPSPFMGQSLGSPHFLCWVLSVPRLGSFAQEDSPQLQHLPHEHGAGWQGGSSPSNVGGHTKESRDGAWGRARWPSTPSANIGLGSSLSCNPFLPHFAVCCTWAYLSPV
ncbi:rCG50827 [Rattus norvegicus]|uniref:RCG50827 n=1 Tax=Rattus norvegicus TaxID=10116 RepID=A6KCM5_RAT|nr:rCG50827 [Rattus norvegicus]